MSTFHGAEYYDHKKRKIDMWGWGESADVEGFLKRRFT